MLRLEQLTDDAFEPFGWVLEPKHDRFQLVLERPDAAGWQIGLLQTVDSHTAMMHRHLDTDECFAPVEGNNVLLVATEADPDDIRAFALTGPACVKAGTWHTMLTRTPPGLVFIAEGHCPTSEDRDTGRRLDCPA
ncbi:MAG: ureidoglycolate lyase [Phycisphaerae bacterium]